MRNGAGKRTFRRIQYCKATVCTIRTHGRKQIDDVSVADWILDVTYTTRNSTNMLLFTTTCVPYALGQTRRDFYKCFT